MAEEKISFDLELSNKLYKAKLDSLIKFSEDGLEAQKLQEESFIKELIDGSVDKEWFSKSAHYNNIKWIILNSIFLSSFSLFEHHIFQLVNIVERRSKNNIGVNDINGKGIHKYRKYLNLIGNLTSVGDNSDWQEIIRFQEVRNKLAHNGGFPITNPTKRQELEKNQIFIFLAKHNINAFGSFGIIRLSNIEFIKSFQKLTEKVCDKIVNEIQEKYPENSL